LSYFLRKKSILLHFYVGMFLFSDTAFFCITDLYYKNLSMFINRKNICPYRWGVYKKMAKASAVVILISLMVLFLGTTFWGIFAPKIVTSAESINSSSLAIQNDDTAQSLLETIPLFVVLGYFLFIVGGLLGIGFGAFMSIKGM